MGKRKDKEIDSIKKKVRKLERKLKKYRSRRSSSTSTRQNLHRDYPLDYKDSEVEYRGEIDEEVPTQPHAEEIRLDEIPGPSSTEKVEEVLEPEILMMLGEDPTTQKECGDDLHKDVAARWSHILHNGLSKEHKSDILKQYLPANNCSNMKAPKLNLEIKAALSPINIKKDLFSQSKQNQLASSLAAIGKALTLALGSKDIPQIQDIIKPLSDAGRLLCDSYFRESQSRRYAIFNNINKQTRDIVKTTKIGEFLFGDNLADHLKSTKAISRSGLQMKSTIQRAPFNPNSTTSLRGTLNARGMARAVVGEPRPPLRRNDTNYRRNKSARQRAKRQ